MINTDKDVGLAFLQGDRRGRIRAPHDIGLLRDNGSHHGLSVRAGAPSVEAPVSPFALRLKKPRAIGLTWPS